MESLEMMQCTRCKETFDIPIESSYEVKYFQEDKIKRLDCPSCGCCVALNFTEEWMPLEYLLFVDDDAISWHGWIEVETAQEKQVFYAMSQIFYRELDPPDEEHHEAVFDLPDESDIIKILWSYGRAIGFYTIKPKGAVVQATMEQYAMPTLDTAYIERDHRKHGHGVSLIEDLVQEYPDEDVAFSKPISHSMLEVIKNFLARHALARNKFWEVDGCGGEGNQKLIWLSLMQHN